jgi:hypothetical protein
LIVSAIVILLGLQWPCYALDEKPIRHSMHFTAEPAANHKGTREQGIKDYCWMISHVALCRESSICDRARLQQAILI